jgi:ubiquitin carboxyl-terminal hydrolase 5/13
MQVDLNIEVDYDATTEGGAELTPVFGAGLVGLRNLGDYCYMNSIFKRLAQPPHYCARLWYMWC